MRIEKQSFRINKIYSLKTSLFSSLIGALNDIWSMLVLHLRLKKTPADEEKECWTFLFLSSSSFFVFSRVRVHSFSSSIAADEKRVNN